MTSTLHGARIHYWPSPAAKPKATLLFIPGNPGLCDYYVAYLTALHRLVNRDSEALEIFCPSQLGHDPLSSTQPAKFVSLDEQVENKARILETISTRWSGDRPRVILSGHSIGAWMAMEVVRRGLNRTQVFSIHLLFPALHQLGQTPNAKQLAWLLRASDRRSKQSINLQSLAFAFVSLFVSIALRLIHFFPIPVVHFFVLLGAPTQPPSAVRTTTNFVLTQPCVRQALSMGSQEMALVREVQQLPTSSGQANSVDVKLRAYWAAGDLDGWAPSKTRRLVESTLGLQKYDLPQDIADKSSPIPYLSNGLKRQKSYSIDEIRKARSSKRRALAGMVRAGASASYGLASSLGNLGYRRGGPSSSAPPRTPPRTPTRRRPSLLQARASRRFDGSIYIEPADGDSFDDLMAREDDLSQEAAVFGSPGIIDRSSYPLLPLTPNGKRSKMTMPSKASIVCKQGFKHAFVLEHSEQMASISAAMIGADMME